MQYMYTQRSYHWPGSLCLTMIPPPFHALLPMHIWRISRGSNNAKARAIHLNLCKSFAYFRTKYCSLCKYLLKNTDNPEIRKVSPKFRIVTQKFRKSGKIRTNHTPDLIPMETRWVVPNTNNVVSLSLAEVP